MKGLFWAKKNRGGDKPIKNKGGFSFPQINLKSYGSDERINNSQALSVWKGLINRPDFNYHLIFVVIILLSCLGLLMQFSSTTIIELSQGTNPFLGIIRPLVYFFLGFLVLFIARAIPPGFYNNASIVILILALAGQSLVLTPLAISINGNQNWIYIRPLNLTVQPSEFLKIAFILFLSSIFASGYCNVKSIKSLFIWVGVPFLVCSGAVYLGSDLGTVLIFTTILTAILIVSGTPGKFFAYGGIGAVFLLVPLVLFTPSRRARVMNFITGLTSAKSKDPLGEGLQTIRAKYGLATGGFTGVGPGASRQKWLYLPEAHTDFIYAILGEELGLLGTVTVLVLFFLLAWALLRLVLQSKNPFLKFVAAGSVGWIVTQAIVNIMVVIGLAPVVGLPLPLVSSGGSSQIASMAMFGVILALLRNEPGVSEYVKRYPRQQTKTAATKAKITTANSKGGR